MDASEDLDRWCLHLVISSIDVVLLADIKKQVADVVLQLLASGDDTTDLHYTQRVITLMAAKKAEM